MSSATQHTTTYRTAESVSPRHPDKLCDQISDAILDAYLSADPHARVAVETCGGHGKVFLTGEVRSTHTVDPVPIVHRIVGDSLAVIVNIVVQSPEIARGVDTGGAGDQGIMVGYATSDTPELLPLETVLARRLNQYLYKQWPHDGKTQVTLENGAVHSVVASFQHAKKAELEARVREFFDTVPEYGADYEVFANPSGDWDQGGFDADAGLTGRKLVVDNYGPRVPIGGGCFSGKDATKVDRSAAYIARRIAVDYLKARHAKEVYCYLAYAIGKKEPLEATVIIDGIPEVVEGYDVTPRGIIDALELEVPQFEETARWGHFGNGFRWDS
jgi:S-adenosylmethionine synthetase